MKEIREMEQLKKTTRTTYDRLIGYCFGEWIYTGCAYDIGYTGKGTKQYFFEKDGTGEIWMTNYKGFKEHISKYNYPKK